MADRGDDEKQVAQEVMTILGQAQTLLTQGNPQTCLKKALSMPLGKDEASKNAASLFFGELVNSIKDTEMNKYIDALTEDERVTALKWVYRAMATGKNCTQLLKWQSAITDKDGIGAIMRVIVDRKL